MIRNRHARFAPRPYIDVTDEEVQRAIRSVPAHYAIGVNLSLGTTSGDNVTSKQSANLSPNPTTGNTLIVLCSTEGATADPGISVADTASNSYGTGDTSSGFTTGHDVAAIFRSTNITGGSNFKVTVTTTVPAYITFWAIEVSGLNASPADGSGNTNTGANSPITTGAFSTTNANDLLVACFANGACSAIGSNPTGFTSIGQSTSSGTHEDGSAVYQIVSSTQSSLNPSWSATLAGGALWAACAFAYKAAAGAFVAPSPMISKQAVKRAAFY